MCIRDRATFLRLNGYKTDLDYYKRSFKAQFKSVERKNAEVVIMLGSKEMANGQIVIKKVATQEQVTINQDDLLHQLQHFLDEDHVCENEGETHV